MLKWEGGLTNNPADPGGLTNFGICQRSYPNLDIKNLTRAQAAEIYERDYWKKSGADLLPWPLNLVVFDTAVNCGVGRAKEWLGVSKDWAGVAGLRCCHYIRLCRQKKSFTTFIKGWMNRISDLVKTAQT